jgi:hypothetical protein
MDEKLRKILVDKGMEKYVNLLSEKNIDTVTKFKKLTETDIVIFGIDKEERNSMLNLIKEMPSDEFVFSGQVTRQESRDFNYSIMLPKFFFYLMVFLLIVVGALMIFGLVTGNYLFLRAFPSLIVLLLFLIGFDMPKVDYVFSEGGFKTSFQRGAKQVVKEYKKGDVKKVVHKEGFVGIQAISSWRGYFIIIDRFFENKQVYNEFIKYLESNYKGKIIHK